jgi:hypothetical protein
MKKDNDIPKNFEDELKHFVPNLFEINKENPFNVPDEYFDELPAMISAKIHEKSSAQKQIILFNPKLYIPLSIGIAAIIILLMVFIMPEIKTKKNNNMMAFINTETSAEELYVDSLIDNNELDESLLTQALINDDTSRTSYSTSRIDNNITNLNKSTVILNDSINKIQNTDDDIIQYLIEDKNNDSDDSTDF